MACDFLDNGAQIRVRGAAAAEFLWNAGREKSPLFQHGVIFRDEHIIGVVDGGALREQGAKLSRDIDPVGHCGHVGSSVEINNLFHPTPRKSRAVKAAPKGYLG